MSNQIYKYSKGSKCPRWGCGKPIMNGSAFCMTHRWIGNKRKHTPRLEKNLYWQTLLYSDDPFYPMASKRGYVYVHRLVMAKEVGRCLTKDEIVHHLNGIRTDNRKENLVIITERSHDTRSFIKSLQARIRELERWCIRG
ncbi:hypothetical protein LCGC14_2474860 [marine sediment metagenome]|uniref:HNH nuclease domain-containing protein n=1 Tax=marine sediment metagenome TaxID=412755 RepID=A0A0F9BA32_9ZZZZ